MDYIYDFIILAPSLITLLMTFTFLTRTHKSHAQRMSSMMAVLATIYLFADALYVSYNEDPTSLIISDIAAHFAAPMLILTAIIFLYYLHKPHRSLRSISYLIVIAFGLGIMVVIPYCMIGWEGSKEFWIQYEAAGGFPEDYQGDNLYEAFYLLDVPIYSFVCGIGLVGLFCYWHHCMRQDGFTGLTYLRFLFKGGEITPFQLECFQEVMFAILVAIRMIMGRSLCLQHPVITAIISLLFAEVSYDILYVGLITHLPDFTLKEMWHPLLFTPSVIPGKKNENMKLLSDDEEALRKHLAQIMEKGYYRNPMLTIEDVANELGTNRVILAHIISTIKGQSFREYITEKRINDAKTFMQADPAATQDEVARHCGFSDAASFNKKFRQAEGLTPREWQISNIRKAKKATTDSRHGEKSGKKF